MIQVKTTEDQECTLFNLLLGVYHSTPMSDQDRISPYNINTILSKQVMRIQSDKYQLSDS